MKIGTETLCYTADCRPVKAATVKANFLCRTILIMSAVFCATAAYAANGAFQKTPHGVTITTPAGVTGVDFYTSSTVRITKWPVGKEFNKKSLSVVAEPMQISVKVKETARTLRVESKKLAVDVDLQTGVVRFADPKGRLLLAEKSEARFVPFDDAGVASFRVTQSFALEPDEPIYGLGNLENGRLSQRGLSTTLQPGNIDDGIPVFVSLKGYGVFWDNYSPTRFTDTDSATTFESAPGDGVDYYFMYGPSADQVVACMRDLTGRVPMMPRWSYGFWQSRERYKSQDELLDVVHNYRERHIPLDGIIQDWQYWGNNYLWNAMEFMSENFRNPKQMIDSVHRSNAHIIISIWSSFGPQTKQYKELDAKGMLFKFSTWPQSGISHEWPPRMDYPSGVRVYDAYNPEARDIYWSHLRRIHDLGMDGWWMDSTEPDWYDATEADFNTSTYLGSLRKVRGAYPLMTVGGVHDHQLADNPDKRVFILTRSGWAGQQRYGCNVWTGDVVSSWDSFRRQIPAGLNFSMTGNPNFNTDLGGFFAGRYNLPELPAVKNPSFHELYVRWMQFGALCPMMRSHGTDVPREIYLYGNEGEPVYDAMVKAVKLRYALLPYIYSTSWRVTDDHYTFMRPLMMDFPTDTTGHNLATQYMFGPSLLVAPVLKPQYTPEEISNATADDFTQPKSMAVYLPKGTQWWDFWTTEHIDGGQWIQAETQFDRIPLYVRAGSIIPIGPDVQFADEKPWDDLEIRVYPGADGTFTLYEDEGSDNSYLQGQHSEIQFKWDDRKSTLTVSARSGEYNGMLTSRKFTVKLPNGRSSRIEYTGKKTSVKI